MINHNIVWFYISVHYSHTVTIIQRLLLTNNIIQIKEQHLSNSNEKNKDKKRRNHMLCYIAFAISI